MQYVRTVFLLLIFVFLGLIVSFHNDPKHQPLWYGNNLTHTQSLLLQIKEDPSPKNKIVKIETKVLAILIDNKWQSTKGNIDINLYKNDSIPPLKIGDQMIISNQLIPILNSGNPFAFRQEDYAQMKGKYHQGFFDHKKVQFLFATKADISWVHASKNKILAIIKNNVKDKTTAGLIAAVIVNERADLDKNLWEDYSRTGIAHIIAISGMHISLFFIILGYLVFFIRHRKYDWIKYALILPVIWAYIIITGFPPSAVRAGIMFTIFSFGIFLRKDAPPINVLLCTAFVILIAEPKWIYDLGFQLSFLSVLSIFIFYKPIVNLWKVKNTYLKWLWQTIAVSLSVQILLFPLLIYYFHQIPLWSVVANIPAAAYSFLFMSGSLVMVFLGSLGIDATWLGNALTLLTEAFHVIVRRLSRWSPDALYSIMIDKMEFWILTISIICSAFYFLSRNKKALYVSATLGLVLIGFFIKDTIQKNKQEMLIVYNMNNKTLIDVINGRTAVTFACELHEKLDAKYSLQPAHIGYGIKTNTLSKLKNKFFEIGQKKVLLLNQSMQAHGEKVFHTDYLIITKNAAFNPQLWKELFNPKTVVLDSSIKRYKAKEYKTQLIEAGWDCHWILEDGALVIQ